MKRAAPAGEEAIEGRKPIADALSAIMGEPVSVYAVDRLAVRKRHPLPLRGYGYKPRAYLSELRAWWDAIERRPRQIRGAP